MIRNNDCFRPWGDLTQILNGDSSTGWAFVGCVSFEDRCVSAYEVLSKSKGVSNSLIFRVTDEVSTSFSLIEEKTNEMEKEFVKSGLRQSEIVRKRLLDSFNEFAEVIDTFYSTLDTQNIVIDISSLPKRLFFFLVKRAIKSNSSIQNILVTCTLPKEYGRGPLAENPERWAPLPGFSTPRSPPNSKLVIVAVGYEPLGLPEIAVTGEFQDAKIALLFPFPADPESVAKNWRFTKSIFPNLDTNAISIYRVDGTNVPEIYDLLMKITEHGNQYSILAPYGPKPMSVAMALFASNYESLNFPPSVFYTQPTNYNLNYSTGVLAAAGVPVINAYCIRLDGENVY